MPPDLDALAWSVAEEDSIAARQEFVRRHPAYADEVARRVELVRERRAAGQEVDRHLAPIVPRRAPLPFWSWLLGGVTLGAVALIFAFPTFRRAAVTTTPDPRVETGVSSPAESVYPAPSAAKTDSIGSTPETPQQQEADDASPLSNPVLAQDTTPPVATADANKPTTIRLAQTPLHTALSLIAEAGGFRVRIDGDLPNPEVAATLKDETPRQMMDDLAGQYGFRVVEETPGSLVVAPLPEDDPAAGNS